jgi:hypothetical protein
MLCSMAYPYIYLLCSRFVGILGGWCHLVSHWHLAWLLSLDSIGGVMTEADKQYMERKQKDWEYDEPEASDYAQFVQQVKGLIVWAIIMFGVYMLVTAVFK